MIFRTGQPLRVGLFVRRPPPFQTGTALTLDWSARFADKEAAPETWRDVLLPALERIAKTIRQHAPGREVEAFGLPTLPAAAALGCAFLSTTGLRTSWRQIAPGRDDQLWTLAQPKEDSGFKAQITSKEPSARDLAVLVSVADNTEPVFAAYQKNLPPLRALVHITRPGAYPHTLRHRARRRMLRLPSRTACARRAVSTATSAPPISSWPRLPGLRC